MKQQTAVEWLMRKYEETGSLIETDFIEAKAMEKEQIINGWDNGFLDYQISMHEDAEQYYNETFGSPE
jgi:hypothetical protein